ncbi:MAG: S46 family peptidase, partial [Chitinophagales bacterium]
MRLRLSVLLFFLVCFSRNSVLAEPPVEGMWLPMLLDQLTLSDMQANGMKFSADEIYSENHASMKDAVCLFANNCTGTVISDEGLLLTNHHCAGGRINSLRTDSQDYLTNGFWAMNHAEEKPCAGLTVTFIISMEDITSKILSVLNNQMEEWQRNLKIDSMSVVVAREKISGTHYGAQVKPFYNGNQFILFVTETFRDVRFVGTPPLSIGNFGGETDDWSWPRQTGDFAVFRIYADKNNAPADYSVDNAPFKPRYSFPVSLSGVKEGDFTMVLGFPGRSNEYASSYAIEFTQNVFNENRNKVNEKIVEVWSDEMESNDTFRKQYLPKYNGVASALKKSSGEVYGLKKADVITWKERYEQDFSNRLATNASWNKKYSTLLTDLKESYDSLGKLQPYITYNDALLNTELLTFASTFEKLETAAQSKDATEASIQTAVDDERNSAIKFFKGYAREVDLDLFAAMTTLYGNEIGFEKAPLALQEAMATFPGDGQAFAQKLFEASFLDDEKKVMSFLEKFKKGSLKKLAKDPVYQLVQGINAYNERFIDLPFEGLRNNISILNRKYMAAQLEVMNDHRFYPDANLSFRIAYGKVESYQPR